MTRGLDDNGPVINPQATALPVVFNSDTRIVLCMSGQRSVRPRLFTQDAAISAKFIEILMSLCLLWLVGGGIGISMRTTGW